MPTIILFEWYALVANALLSPFQYFQFQNTGHLWRIPLPSPHALHQMSSISKRHVFYLNDFVEKTQSALNVQLQTNLPTGITIKLSYDPTPVDMHVGVVYAAFVLFLLYVLIIYEVSHSIYNANLKYAGFPG